MAEVDIMLEVDIVVEVDIMGEVDIVVVDEYVAILLNSLIAIFVIV